MPAFAFILFDKKAISPDAEEYDGIIHGIILALDVNDIASLRENGYPSMLRKLIENFSSGVRRWVKGDVAVAVPVASYALETTGEYQDVQKRVDKVLRYENACGNCLQHSALTGESPVRITICLSCFQSRAVCDQQVNIFQTWVPDNCPCVRCAELDSICCQFKIVSTIRDMDPSREKYEKNVSGSFEYFITGKS